MIRLIEVEPAVPGGPASVGPPPGPETAPVPVVQARSSRFVVLLESFESLVELGCGTGGDDVTPGRRLRRQGWQPRTLVWGASGILLLVSALVTWVPERDRRSSRPRVPFEPSSTLSLSPDSKETREAPHPTSQFGRRSDPAREAEGWSFDLFTAPTLFAGASGGGWSATRPEGIETDRTEPGAPEADVPVPLRVVEIVQDLFPVQLAGFGRSPRGSFGVFHLVATREVVVAREGDRLGRLPWRERGTSLK